MPEWTRILDDHNFTLPAPARGSCRMQILSCADPDEDALLVATQVLFGYDEGPSLSNAAEDFILHAWRTYLPGQQRPPAMAHGYVSDLDERTGAGMMVAELVESADHRTGYAAGFRGLKSFERQAVLDHAELGRGERYVPKPTQPSPYRETWHDHSVALLPETRPFREECLKQARRTGTIRGVLHRLRIGALVPVGASCCWYHQGSWAAATEAARTVLRRLEESPPADDDFVVRADAELDSLRLDDRRRDADEADLSGCPSSARDWD